MFASFKSWFSGSTNPDFKQLAINCQYNVLRTHNNTETYQRHKIAQMFEEASNHGSDEIAFNGIIEPSVISESTSIGYTIKDGTTNDYHNIGGNTVEFREIPCKIIKLPSDSN